MKSKILISCLILMFVTGCASNDSMATDENVIILSKTDKNQYARVIPYELSLARYWHGNKLSRFDPIVVEKGLEERAKEYFSVNSYLQGAGKLLDADQMFMLQRHASDNYPYGLNPPLGDFEVTGAIVVSDPYIIYDVVEMDFYSVDNSNKLTGLAFVILMNSAVRDGEGSTVTIPVERLYSYGSDMGRKLEKYIRTLRGVDADCPIYITLYASSLPDSSLPGVFIGDAYFTGRSGQFRAIHEEWALFPSDKAQRLDATLYAQFVAMKNALHYFLPENVDITGLGRFENDQAQSLKITMNVQAKTYSEVSALAQYTAQLCNDMDTTMLDLSIEIKMFDKTYFTMVKRQGESEMSIHDIS